MNEQIQQLAKQADAYAWQQIDEGADWDQQSQYFAEKFAQLIVQECMAIARNREDELESANLLRESRAVGIVVYRMARKFGVKE